MCAVGALQRASQQMLLWLQRRGSSILFAAGKAQGVPVTAEVHAAAVLLPRAFVWLSPRNKVGPFNTRPYFFPPAALSCPVIAVQRGGVPATAQLPWQP